jgi:hypothetical protein
VAHVQVSSSGATKGPRARLNTGFYQRSRIAEDTSLPPDVRIRAMAEDSKMQGHYEPEQHVVETGPNTLESIKERAEHVASLMSRAYEVQ